MGQRMIELFPGTRALIVAMTTAVNLSVASVAQEACTTYEVQVGDTLRTIAFTAYGSPNYQIIYNANRDILNLNPIHLEPGTLLNLPCNDGSLMGVSVSNDDMFCTDSEGERVDIGGLVCLRVDGREFTAQCRTSQNQPIWREVAESCNIMPQSVRPPQPTSRAKPDERPAVVTSANASTRTSAPGQGRRRIPHQRTKRHDPPLRFLARSNCAPYSATAMTEGGLLPILARTAMKRGGNSRDSTLAFVYDWGAYLDSLLSKGTFDIGLGLYMPDCTMFDHLSPISIRKCNEYIASVPVYESVIAYFARPGTKWATATSFDKLRGARFCRMNGYFTHDLEEEGLSPPDIEYLRPDLPEECIQAVDNGIADVTGFELEHAVDVIGKLGIEGHVVEIPALAKVATLSFIAHRANPFGRGYIVMLNRGLNEMRETGEWHDIVSHTLSEHTRMMRQQEAAQSFAPECRKF